MAIGGLLRQARVDARLSQAKLAQASGTSQAALSAYERDRKSPSAATLARILAATGFRLATKPTSGPVVVPTAEELRERGAILAAVIDLAEHLPSRRGSVLEYPPLRTKLRTRR